ncbi:MAG: hypothetical protein GY882_11675 [Actinomycetia bacterium]|nr:hypothetical protein [Actinomycetes bacterium]MCP4845758.1 hypothetical protein [Actinomycetes bacterium]
MIRFTRTLLTLVVAAALLTGCRADLVTSIEVAGDGDADITVSFTATGELAAALADAGTSAPFAEAIEARTSSDVEFVRDGDVVRWSETVDYPTFVSSADLVGISEAVIQVGDERVGIALALTSPTGLSEAFAAAGGDRHDAGDIARTYAANTFVSLHLEFPADALIVDDGGIDRSRVHVAVEGSSIELVASVADWPTTTFIASGVRSTDAGTLGTWVQLAMVGLGIAVVGLGAGRLFGFGPLARR